jgi:hypothetical protein
MRKKETKEYFRRWEKIKERERTEIRQTPFEIRFIQTDALMQFANSLKSHKEYGICDNWVKLKKS